MAEETNFTPITSERRPAPTQESTVRNASARQDNEQNNRRADIEERDVEGGSDRVVITQGAIDLSRGGGSGTPETQAVRATVETERGNNLTNRSSPLQENEPPDLTFRNLNGSPNPNDNEVEQALQRNPVDSAVRSSRVITENNLERVSAGDAVEQRNADNQTESVEQPRPAEGPERGTDTTQNRVESQETQSQETQASEEVVREEASQEQTDNRTREQQGEGSNPTAVQSEIGQNLDNLV